MQPKYLAFGTLVVALLVQVSPARPHALAFEAGRLVPTRLPTHTILREPIMQADLNMDGRMEKLSIEKNTARISSGNEILWQSPEGWLVMEAAVTDLNRDGAMEAALLVWRPFKAWPVDEWLPQGGRIEAFHDARGDSCQMILIGWREGGFHEVWAGSALAEPVRSFLAVDLNGDGKQELVTLEGSYQEPRRAPGRILKVWEWNGFGFSNVYRMNGLFDAMAAVRSGNGQTLILIP